MLRGAGCRQVAAGGGRAAVAHAAAAGGALRPRVGRRHGPAVRRVTSCRRGHCSHGPCGAHCEAARRGGKACGGDSPLLELDVVTTSRCIIRASTCCVRKRQKQRGTQLRRGWVRETHGKARKLLAGYDLFDKRHLFETRCCRWAASLVLHKMNKCWRLLLLNSHNCSPQSRRLALIHSLIDWYAVARDE